MTSNRLRALLPMLVVLSPASAQAGPWQGFVDRSDELGTDQFGFKGTFPEQIQSNENYYDGDFADFDGDGVVDRSLGSRYGLMFNRGGGFMTPYSGYTGFLFRGMPGAESWGEDAFGWADVDSDGDYDNLSGGNGEPLTLQTNRNGRFATRWQKSHSALNIVNTDVERDGDVDLVVAHAFCSQSNCGGPVEFSLLINDGDGDFTEESAARGVAFGATDYIVAAASGDVDGDGDFDLVIEHGAIAATVIARNDGSGNYTVAPTPLPTTCSGFGQALNLGDIDDDGDLDIVMGRCREQSGPNNIVFAAGINAGDGTFTDESAMRFDGAGHPGILAGEDAKLMDADYDGDLDWVALRTEGGAFVGHHMQVWLNDGAGMFTLDAGFSFDFPAAGSALGSDIDVTDLDGDGAWDVWLGMGGDRVRILTNTFVDDAGIPGDQPRALQVESAAAGEVVLTWTAPPFAATARRYHVYRATAPALERRDQRLVHVVGSRHQDEAFAAPITRHMTTADLADPAVELDGAQNLVRFRDTSVEPGVTYWYTVTHVGAENAESSAAPEVTALVPGGSEDGTGPMVDILGPSDQDWWAYPRVVAHLADGGSGIDPTKVRLSFDADLGDPMNGGRAAGDDLSDLAYRLDGGVVILPLVPQLALPDQTLATLTVTAEDMDGNSASAQRQLFVGVVAAQPPLADLQAAPTMGTAPLTVAFDASGSSDADGKLLRWEWLFGDGTTGLGRVTSHEYKTGGTFTVTLIVRDNDGGVAVTSRDIDVDGPEPECDLGQTQGCYSGPAGTMDVGTCQGGTQSCDGGLWGACVGEVVPATEDCTNAVDDDCDGLEDAQDDDCGGPGTSSSGGGTAGGTDTDSGSTGGQAGGDSGCGCSGAPAAPTSALALGVWVAATRRRRRTDRS